MFSSVNLQNVVLVFFFFLMIRRPPRSTLFPTRRSSDLTDPRIEGEAHFTLLPRPAIRLEDRKSTRLNSSHANISYAVFCLKKKKNIKTVAHMNAETDIAVGQKQEDQGNQYPLQHV